MLEVARKNQDKDGVHYVSFKEYVGATIKSIEIDSDLYFQEELVLVLDNGKKLGIKDDAQQCCEERFITIDKNEFKHHIGAKLLDITLSDAEDGPNDYEYDIHDIAFLDIKTSNGVLTATTHNVHNGCYSGFSLYMREVWEMVAYV